MARAPTISDDQILEAARSLFLEQGFKASTAAIAKAAGVSEGTIFKRFPNKAKLFYACMHLRSLDEALRLLDGLSAQPIEEAMEFLVINLVQKMRTFLPHMMMLWANATPQEIFEGMDVPPPVRVLEYITTWIESEVERGRLRTADPRLLARVLLGSSLHFVFFEAMGLAPPGDELAFARRLRGLLMEGVGAEGEGR